ncbi:serine/threonine-protein kinase [Aspergillus novofumigatus IBT 16806]|uniref:non-specific serine/threonine protein kinase n=1 Tax=Aspergillus novofumigatus (strain IBT 16806) TaxID=1392255 RepID=A0A2I1CD06_ASPN1|nr:kinase-like protein [Aspergillus novofumigatus IBT 16806]PKX95513.1 kinase-like protein [Aspergillus novofumigatus IBT 16806]
MAHQPSSEEAGGGQAVNDAVERGVSSCLSSHDQRVSEEVSPPSAAEQISRGSISARLKRNSSKLLSLLGLRNSSNAGKAQLREEETFIHPTNPAESSHSSGSCATKDVYSCRSTQSRECPCVRTAGISAQSRSSTLLDSSKDRIHTCQNVAEGTDFQPRLLKTDVVDSTHRPTFDTRRTNSTSAVLTDIVAYKLSTAFGYPTVIRRSHLRSRPQISAVHFVSPQQPLSKQGDGADDARHSDDPSTSPCDSGSPMSTNSTPPTSEEPSSFADGWKQSSQNVAQKHQRLALPDQGPPRNLTPIQESPNVTPSIYTVEAAANAKIFFETYFNTIFHSGDPRLERRIELERCIHKSPLTPEEKARATKNWLDQEREHLRQYRLLKSRPHRTRRNETVALAGYEMVKVLGRGSFGVVRLVKEKRPKDGSGYRVSEGSSSSFRKDRFNSLRSALSGAERDHRRPMTRATKDVFAMKVIRKSVMIRNCQEGHLRAERDFLVASAKSRWVVPLIASFQDHNYLYLVMDYMVGGDFLGLLMRKNILPEHFTRWYAAEMILCVEEAHKLRWIHRDVKPDNFLISASGHMKISDFGLAFDGHWAHDQAYYNEHRYSLLEKLGIQIDGDREDREEHKSTDAAKTHNELKPDRNPPSINVLDWRDNNQKRRFARSIVGTSQYMAPEIIRGKRTTGDVTGGCLYGFTPFASMDRQETKWKIHHHVQTLFFPAERPADLMVSTEAIDLINRLLQDKEYRLSSSKYKVNESLILPPNLRRSTLFDDSRNRNYQGFYVYADDAGDIKAHPFFHGISWRTHHLTEPPFTPKVDGWEDTRYFDDNEDSLGNDDVSLTSEENQGQDEVDGGHTHEPGPEKAQSQQKGSQPDKKDSPEPAKKNKHRKKDKHKRRRPRDKLLRDPRVGKTVLDIRKRGAFLGYTYRRPNAVALALVPERGRSMFRRGHLSELYGY